MGGPGEKGGAETKGNPGPQIKNRPLVGGPALTNQMEASKLHEAINVGQNFSKSMGAPFYMLSKL
jgi:hypothetical protein